MNKPHPVYNFRLRTPAIKTNVIQITCYCCGEEGHYTKECMAETQRQAYPSQRKIETRSRRSELDSADERRINRNRNLQTNVVTIQELTSSDSDDDYQVYPVVQN